MPKQETNDHCFMCSGDLLNGSCPNCGAIAGADPVGKVIALQNQLSDLQAKLAQAEAERKRKTDALEAIMRRVPIMGSEGEYRRGQEHALEACREIAREALNPAKPL